jgi:hypothetical protein
MSSGSLLVEDSDMDADEKRRRLGRVYKILIDLARQKDTGEEGSPPKATGAPD